MRKYQVDTRVFFASIGVFYYLILCAPFIRQVLFGDGAKILDMYSGELSDGAGDAFSFFTKYVLFIPYFLNQNLFSYFDVAGSNILVMAIMSVVVYRYFSYARSWKSFIFLAFLFIPVPLLFLSSFNKDVLLVVAVFFAYGYRKDLSCRDSWYVFFAYAFFMRAYLMVVPAILKIRNLAPFVLFSMFVLIIGLNVDGVSEVFFRLFNRRLVEKGFSANSELNQTVVVDGVLTLVEMLLEVLPQIVFPIFYSFGLKTIFFQIYVSLFLWTCVFYRNVYSNLFLFLFFFYSILDPDLGAFFRHLTSFFILFPLMLGMKRMLNEKA